MANTKTCTHIKVTGVRCGSPALYGEQFCYFHQHAHRGVRKPPQSRLHPIAILEDEESIQSSLMEVINALMRNTIDLKRAELILRALHIAVKNARRAKFSNQSDAVREVPEYRAETDTAHVETAASAVQRPLTEAQGSIAGPGEEDELPAVAASTYKPVHPDPEFWERWERGGQELKRREAEAKANVGTAATASGQREVGKANFRKETPAAPKSQPEPRRVPQAPNSEAAPQRKPVACAPVPKERKNAAPVATHG